MAFSSLLEKIGSLWVPDKLPLHLTAQAQKLRLVSQWLFSKYSLLMGGGGALMWARRKLLRGILGYLGLSLWEGILFLFVVHF